LQSKREQSKFNPYKKPADNKDLPEKEEEKSLNNYLEIEETPPQ